jgi:hypothetical protein
MVCIQGTPESIDVATMLAGICNNLPSYARPIFFRFADDLDMTGRRQMEQNPLPNSFTLGLESMILSTVFRSRIRMFLGLLDLDPKLFVSILRRILPSTNIFEKNLDFCCLVTVLHNQFFFL